MAKGYVYFLHDPVTETLKIGASRDPESRIANIQNAAPQKLFCIRYVEVSIPFETERLLHDRFADLRSRGDWFCVTPDLLKFATSGKIPNAVDPKESAGDLPPKLSSLKAKPSKRLGLKHLSAKTGISGRTIRYYISQGLVPGPLGKGKASRYSKTHLEILKKIRKLREKGLSLQEIKWELFPEEEGLDSSSEQGFWEVPKRYTHYEIAEGIQVIVEQSRFSEQSIQKALETMRQSLEEK